MIAAEPAVEKVGPGRALVFETAFFGPLVAAVGFDMEVRCFSSPFSKGMVGFCDSMEKRRLAAVFMTFLVKFRRQSSAGTSEYLLGFGAVGLFRGLSLCLDVAMIAERDRFRTMRVLAG